MRLNRGIFCGLALCVLAVPGFSQETARVAPRPLFRDPVFDGAADPTLIFDRARNAWRMFYTNRRANASGIKGVSYCHGTRLGIAESSDGGNTWAYRGFAQLPYGEGEYSFWAPDIVYHEGVYHLFVTYVPGMHEDWSGTRNILHFTSPDLDTWKFIGQLALTSDHVIDPCVMRLPEGKWRLWYKDEAHKSHTYVTESADLGAWSPGRPAESKLSCEGANVFFWKGLYWLITDMWEGQAVYWSQDAMDWQRQAENILKTRGTGLDDNDIGRHADVVVNGERAFIFYFTHPGRGADRDTDEEYETRRSSIQVAELTFEAGVLGCDRNARVSVDLGQPATQDENGAAISGTTR